MRLLLKYSAIVAAIITGVATLGVPFVNWYIERYHHSPISNPLVVPSPSPDKKPNVISLDTHKESPVDGRYNNGQQIIGNGNQVTINGPASTHPVTFGMGLKWNLDDFAETVRNGNLPAIKEYLNPNDGFDPNALRNGNIFVLQLPIYEGTKNFPQILGLFKETGRLNWNELNQESIFSGVYRHPITLQWALLQEAANKSRPADLKSLIDAGADPSQLLADEVKALRDPVGGGAIYPGALLGKTTDLRHANVEQELVTFKSIGYPIPNLREGPSSPEAQRQERMESSHTIEACKQNIRSHHSMKELMALATNPSALSQVETWQPFQSASSYLSKRLMQGGWRGDSNEYEDAINKACSPQVSSNPF